MKNNVFNNSAVAFITFGFGSTDEVKNDSGDLIDYNEDQIKTIFMDQLRKFGQTTSLDVKIALRRAGFFAQQRTVSSDLRDISEQNSSIESYSNGTFITYYLDVNQMDEPGLIDVDVVENPQVDAINDAVVTEAAVIRNDGPTVSYTRRNGDVMVARKLGTSGDWECKHAYKKHDPLYFDSNWTRDQVRAAYASLTKEQNNDVRARKVK